MIKLVPRLEPYGAPNSTSTSNRARVHRPTPKLFNPQDYIGAMNRRDPILQEIFTYWNGQQFKDGYLFKYVNMKNLKVDNINPQLEEVQQLTNNNEEEANWNFNKFKLSFVKGDKVRVLRGDLKGITGIVTAQGDKNVLIKPTMAEL